MKTLVVDHALTVLGVDYGRGEEEALNKVQCDRHMQAKPVTREKFLIHQNTE